MTLAARFRLLTALRWLPTGLVIPVMALLPLQRGMSVAEMGTALAVQGIVVLCLELPMGALADTWGRRPLFVASAVLALASYGAFAVATTPLVLALAAALSGVFRALDSGALNAWFVDEVHSSVAPERRADAVTRGLGGASGAVGVSIAGGSLLSAGLVAWSPGGPGTALVVPFLAASGLVIAQIVAAALLMHEPRRRAAGAVHAVQAVRDGVRLLAGSRVLRALIAVEIFWGFGMVAFETYMPVRLSELLGDRDLAAAILGPVIAAAWGVAALGAAAVPVAVRRWGLVRISVALRLAQGAFVIAMGLAWGPVGLLAGFLATYAVHMAAGVAYEALLHQEVDSAHRATVLSLASMAMQPAGSIGTVVLGLIAAGASTGLALVTGGVVLALAAPLFLVRARSRAADGRAATTGPMPG